MSAAADPLRCPGCGRRLPSRASLRPRRHRRVEEDPASAWCDGRPAPARVSLRITGVEIEAEGELPVGAALEVLAQLGRG